MMRRFFAFPRPLIVVAILVLCQWPVSSAYASFDSDADTSVMEGLGWRLDMFSDYQSGGLLGWAQLLPQADGKTITLDLHNNGLALVMGRINGDGSMDAGFGNQGWTSAAFNWTPVNLQALLQSDGKIVVAADFDNETTITLMRFLADGQMDNSFGGNGRINFAYSHITTLAQQSTGKLILGTNTGLIRLNSNGSLDNTFNIAQQSLTAFAHVVHSDDSIFIYDANPRTIKHLSADGVVDPSFGSGGVATLPLGIISATMTIVANKLWIGGFAFSAGNFPGAVYRLNLNGSFDTGFDGDGGITFFGSWAVPSIYTFVSGMAVNSSQQVLLWYNGNNGIYQAIRFNANGTLDTTFSGDGYYDPVNTPISDLTLQGNKIVLSGYDQSVPQGLIRCLDSSGNLDVSFAGDGENNEIEKMGSTIYRDSIRLSDGKLLAVGVNGNHQLSYSIPPRLYWPTTTSLELHTPSQCLVARYDSNGEPDVSFHSTGHTLFNPNLYCSLAAVKELHNGYYLLAGSSAAQWTTGGGHRALLMQLNSSSGKLDSSFDGDGIVEVAADLVYYRLEQQSDDKILVMGIDDSANGVVIRYHTDGSVDTSYALNGRLVLTGSKRFSGVLQSDDKLVLYLLDGKLKRFNVDGTLDESFGNKGEVVVNGINSVADFAFGNWLVLKNNGKTVIVESTGDSQFRLRQFDTTGAVDANFGVNGLANLPDVPALMYPPLKWPTDFRMVSMAQDQQGNTLVLGHADLDDGGSNFYKTQIILLRYSDSGQLDQHLFSQSDGVAQPTLANTWIYPTDIHPGPGNSLWLTGSVVNFAGSGSGAGAGLLFKMKGLTADYDSDGIANDIDTDVEGDQLPDSWENYYFGDRWLWSANDNPDLDTWNMLKEYQMNTNPGNGDSDGDGINDHLDYNPLNAILRTGNETLPLDSSYKGSRTSGQQLGH